AASTTLARCAARVSEEQGFSPRSRVDTPSASRKLFRRDRRPRQRRLRRRRRATIRSASGARMTTCGKAVGGSMVDRYLDLPYHVTLVRDPDGNGAGWTAGVEELPGCSSQGGTPDEAVNGIRQAMAAWITR